MNMQHLKYVVAVADAGSVKKAAEKLCMNQPNLSRAVKEFEEELGFAVFSRTPKGMVVTEEGEEFIKRGKKLLGQMEELEEFYKSERRDVLRFSLSAPRVSYIARAFERFAQKTDPERESELYYRETNSMRAINNILNSECRLAIVRYASEYDVYFQKMAKDKSLSYELIKDFERVIVMSKNHPLAQKDAVSLRELYDYTELAYADPYVPSVPSIDVKRTEFSDKVKKKIFLFERASQFDLLEHNSGTFMRSSPLPRDFLEKYSLVQKRIVEKTRRYRDVLLSRAGYELTKLDKQFLDELKKVRDETWNDFPE